MASAASVPTNPDRGKAWQDMHAWIGRFVEARRHQPRRGDVVDAVLAAEIEGEPITEDAVIGVIQLLILGGLETTAGALGQFMIRFCHEPEIPARLRAHPERIPDAAEELLRLEPPFIAIARTAMTDTEIGGRRIRAGDKVLIYWASANRDEGEFACPADFDLDRASNRHLAFGAGPHRCAGSNLARLNLRRGPGGGRGPAGRPAAAGGRRADPVPLGAEPGAADRADHLHPRAPGRRRGGRALAVTMPSRRW